MRLTHRVCNQFFADVYRKTWKALRKSQHKETVARSRLISARAYQNNLVKELEPVLAKILVKVGMDAGVKLKIFVGYIRSSLLHYDGRIDLYLRNTWFVNSRNGIEPNINTERKINRILWEPEIGVALPWIHILQHITDSGDLVLLAGQSPLRNILETDWNGVSLDRSVEAVRSDISGIGSDLTNVLSDQTVRELLEQVSDKIVTQETEPLRTLFADDKDKAIKALVNPVRVMAKFKLPNLIYVPLLSYATGNGRSDEQQWPSALDGGAVFTLESNVDPLSSTTLGQYIENLREALRQCLVFPMLCAEERFQEMKRESQEETYFQRYYNPARPPEIPLVDHLKQQSGSPPRAAGPLFEGVSAILDELSRMNIREPRDIARHIFVGIEDLWGKWNVVRANSLVGNNSNLLNLLEKLLDFEEQLKYIPGYREHFVHSIHVLALGMILVTRLDPFSVWRESTHFWKSWFMTALFHDFGIPVAKAPEAVEELIRQDFQLTTIEHLLWPEITWHRLLLEKNFYGMLRNRTLQQLLSEQPRPVLKTRPGTFLYERGEHGEIIRQTTNNLSLMLSKHVAQHFPDQVHRKYDHAIVSALLLYAHSCKHEEYWPSWQKAMRAAVLPVMLHHSWDLMDQAKPKGATPRNLFVYPHDGFLLYLLTLCDAVCQQGRSFEGFQASGVRPAIKLADIQFKDGNRAEIVLDYEAWRSREDQKDLVCTLWPRYMEQVKDFFDFGTSQHGPVVKIKPIVHPSLKKEYKLRMTPINFDYVRADSSHVEI